MFRERSIGYKNRPVYVRERGIGYISGGEEGGGRNRKREVEREGVRRQRGGIAFYLRFGRDSV